MPSYRVYKSKSHNVNAIQFTGHNITDVVNFVQPKAKFYQDDFYTWFCLETEDETYVVEIGEWIVERGLDGALYVLDDGSFRWLYEQDV